MSVILRNQLGDTLSQKFNDFILFHCDDVHLSGSPVAETCQNRLTNFMST